MTKTKLFFKTLCKHLIPILYLIPLLLVVVSCGKTSYTKHEDKVMGPTLANDRPEYVEDEVLIKLKSGLSEQELDDFMVRNHLISLNPVDEKLNALAADDPSGVGRWYKAEIEGEYFLEDVMLSLDEDTAVEEFEENGFIYIDGTVPNDSRYGSLWGMHKIQASDAWDVTTGNKNVVVAVIDTGVDLNHYDIAPNKWVNSDEIPGNGIDDDGNGYIDDVNGWDFANNDNNPYDDHGHGTHCAGTIGGAGNDGQGVVGVNWKVSIMAVKFLTSSGSGTYSAAINSIRYAVDNGAVISSNSWGGYSCSSCLSSIINYARSKNHLLIAAAANDNNNNDGQYKAYPCSYTQDNVVCVAATDSSDRRAGFSNYGRTNVDLAAPGVGILSSLPGNRFASWSGTSMATPHVSGVAALIKAADLSMNYADIKNVIMNSVDKKPEYSGLWVSEGRLNAKKAISSVNNPPAAPLGVNLVTNNDNSVTVQWAANSEDDMEGYVVYYGTSSRNYPQSYDTHSLDTSATITDLTNGQLYYFAVKAYDDKNALSSYSNELTTTSIDTISPSAIIDLGAAITDKIPLELSVSSVSGNYSGQLAASNLIDNDVNTYWSPPLSENNEVQYIVLDLGAVESIDFIRLHPAVSYPEFFPLDFELQTSLDGNTWESVVYETDFIALADEWIEWLFSATDARYLRIYITASSLHENGYFYSLLSEIMVYGQTDVLTAGLGWTSTGDDENGGTANRYYIKMTDSSDMSEEEFNSLPDDQISAGNPQAAGNLEFLTVPDLQGESVYSFAMKVSDEAGNTSGLSNVATINTAGIPPASVGDLQIAEKTPFTVLLKWSAPGDDGLQGQAHSYAIRYSTEMLNRINFDSSIPVPAGNPSLVGTEDSTLVENLIPETTYYFALVSYDETGNRSGLSNVVSTKTTETHDITPPAYIDNLFGRLLTSNYGLLEPSQITSSGNYSEEYDTDNIFDESDETSWASPDLEDGETAYIQFDLGSINTVGRITAVCSRFLPTLFPVDFKWQLSTNGSSWETMIEETGYETEAGEVNEWIFEAMDARFVRMYISETSDSLGFHHAVIGEVNIYKAFVVSNSVELSWLAPGDNEFEGEATEYDVKYSTFLLNESTFQSATSAPNEPVPSITGSFESMTVENLAGETVYYFGLKTADEAGNYSGLSNIVSVETLPIPPAPIKDLEITDVSFNDLILNWTATGDDMNFGTATEYDLRFSTSPITYTNFENAERISGTPSPLPSGQTETFSVYELNSDVVYYFAIKAIDDKGNTSSLSNVVHTKTNDNIRPDSINDLVAAAPLEDLGLMLKAKVADYSSESVNSNTFLVDGNIDTYWISEGTDSGCDEFVTVELKPARPVDLVRLHPSTTYPELFPKAFSIQLSLNGSNWTNAVQEINYTAENMWTDWSFTPVLAKYIRVQITDCNEDVNKYYAAIGEIEIYEEPDEMDMLMSAWTATGDNGNIGKAYFYDMRYSTEYITESNFNSAAVYSSTPVPQDPGSKEHTVVRGLQNDTTYYLAIKVRDEADNMSEISNIASATTIEKFPGKINNLSIVDTGILTISLRWNAPAVTYGDKAQEYDIRYSNKRINHSNWDLATTVNSNPEPNLPGVTELFTVDGLSAGTQYFIAIRSIDEHGNKSRISNVVKSTTQPPPETIPPSKITDLAANTWQSADGAIELTWTAPGDDNNTGTAALYDLRKSYQPITPSNFQYATPVLNLNSPNPAGTTERVILDDLDLEELYYFAIRTSDDVGNGSEVSNTADARTREVAPLRISNLEVSGKTLNSISLTWTATGDNGNVGRAAEYDFRYSTSFITQNNWVNATRVNSISNPANPGTAESLTVSNLIEDTTYYFAIKTIDARNNESVISNVADDSTIDNVPPSTITDLTASTYSSGASVLLQWTTPGDNGITGKASEYDVRYSTNPITSTNFSNATRFLDVPTPQNPLVQQSVLVSDLNFETRYYFAVKTIDESDNVSTVSNSPYADTQGIAPDRIINLSASLPTLNSIKLTWTATGSDRNEGTASQYDLRFSETPLTELNFTQATRVDGLATPKPSGNAETYTVSSLNGNTLYYFAIKAIDEHGNTSKISNITGLSTVDPDPPADIADLQATTSHYNRAISLTWTAPGDNGMSGKANSYDIRYSKTQITASNFDSALIPVSIPVPYTGGSPQTLTLSNLDIEETYYFAIKTKDEVPNWSGISNVPSAMTKQMNPAKISDLNTDEVDAFNVNLTWTAKGDNGSEGKATGYDIRYSTSNSTLIAWTNAVQVQDEPAPLDPGSSEVISVHGFDSDTKYYLAVKTIDDLGNVSDISNIINFKTDDVTPPSNITDLTAVADDTNGKVILSWTAVGDDGTEGIANEYDIRYSKQIITAENFNLAQTSSNPPSPGESGVTLNHTVTLLDNEEKYYFAIKTKDDEDNLSELSNVAFSFTKAIAPARILDLNTVTSSYNSVSLTWTASGDDNNSGTASSYDIRYSTVRNTLLSWTNATKVSNPPTPKVAGSSESFTVTELSANTKYYFAIKAIDDQDAESDMSNIVDLATLDDVPPAAITEITIDTTDTQGAVNLVWTSPGDDGNEGTATEYDVRYSKSLITADNFNDADRFSWAKTPYPAGYREVAHVNVLEYETLYYFAIKTGDDSNNWSDISIVISEPTIAYPPSKITDLAYNDPSYDTVALTWTAHGDNGDEGNAYSYDIRYSTSISEVYDWTNATPVNNSLNPKDPGSSENFTVLGLSSSTKYYLAVKIVDTKGNSSQISNVITFDTLDDTNPGKIDDLVANSYDSNGVVELTWTAVGDDGDSEGTAASYIIKYSLSNITKNNFDNAVSIPNNPPYPGINGSAEKFLATGLPGEELLYFAVKAVDESGNAGDVSNSPSQRTKDELPAAITDLGIHEREANDLTLSWTATGDNGTEGNALTYDLRYSTSMITEENFDGLDEVSDILSPAASGLKEYETVRNLVENQAYYFAVKAIDDRGNKSPISNILTTSTLDPVAPEDVTSLRALPPPEAGEKLNISILEVSGSYSSEFSQDNLSDSNTSTDWATPQRSEIQDEYVTMSLGSTNTIGKVRIFPSRDFPNMFPKDFIIEVSSNLIEWESVTFEENYQATPGIWQSFSFPPMSAKYVRFYITEPGGYEDSYYVIFSEIQVFAAPSRNDIMELRWIASGDDGNEGTASLYDIRYSLKKITDKNFDDAESVSFSNAQLVLNVPTPAVSGTLESMTVEGLTPETKYYFALKVKDEEGNASNLSNVANAMTLGIAPARITDITSTDITSSAITIQWTAPGDDEMEGQATSYHIRYSTSPISEANWSLAQRLNHSVQPSEAGLTDSIQVQTLVANTTYYIGIKTEDDTGRLAVLSSLFSATTLEGPDNTAPEEIDSLSVLTSSQGGSTLSANVIDSSGSQFPDYTMTNLTDGDLNTDWSTPPRAAMQDEYIIMSLNDSYTISKISIEPSEAYPEFFPIDFKILVSTDNATWTEIVSKTGFVIESEENWQVFVFKPVLTKYIKILSTKSNALDERLYFTMMAEVVVEEASLDSGTAVLSWVAPGDDGAIGTAEEYDIRYSTIEINNNNFDSADIVPDIPTPLESGSLQSATLTGLDPYTGYYFAIKSTDEKGNQSHISNVVYVEPLLSE